MNELDDIGASPLTTSTNIAMAIEQTHPIVIACGMLFALPRKRRPMEFVNSSRLIQLGNNTFKDTLNSPPLYASNDYVKYFPVSILNEEKERGIKPVIIAANWKQDWVDPMKLGSTFPQLVEEMENEKEPLMSSTKLEHQLNLEKPPKKRSLTNTSRFGLNHGAHSNDTKE